MKLFVLLALCGLAKALPQYNYNVPHSGPALTSSLAYDIPEGCTFISSTKQVERGVISGEYSYEDPVGSTVTVTYSVNEDGTDYTESRKIIKGYKTDGVSGGSSTEDKVVETVKNQLKDTIITVIQQTVHASSSVVLDNPEDLVQTIIVQLRPVVLQAVQSALATSSLALNDQHLTDRIITEITPFVRSGVEQEIKLKQENSQHSADKVVTLVIQDLEPVVMRIIEATVKVASASDLAGYDNLVETIIVQLRPVVLNEVKKALRTSTTYKSLNAQDLTNRIIVELRPFIVEAVQTQVKALEEENSANVVKIVIQKLRPIVLRVIRESVRNSREDLDNYQNLVQTIVVQLRPIVLREVQRALTTATKYGTLDAKKLTNQIIIQLESFVRQGVQEQVREFQSELKASADEVVSIVISQLEPIVIRVIAQTVRSANPQTLGNINTLVQTISDQLTPVVFNEVQKDLATSAKYKGILDANELTERIIIKLKPFIQQGVEEQVEALRQENQVNPDEIIQQIISKLRPIVIQVIQRTVQQSSADLTNTEGLVTAIVSQLRPVVLREVTQAIPSSFSSSLNANDLTQKIVIKLTPFVREGVKKEVQQVRKTQGGDRLVQSVISQLTPFIVTTVNNALGSSQKIEEKTAAEASQTFLVIIRPIIRDAVIRVMTQGSGGQDQESLITQVKAEMQSGLLLRLIRQEVQKILGAQATLPPKTEFEKLLESLRPQIRLIIIEELRTYKQENELSTKDQAQIVATVLRNMRVTIEQTTVRHLQAAGSGASDKSVINYVMGQLRAELIQILNQQLSGYSVSQSGTFTQSQAYDELLATLMRDVRVIIIQQIKVFRAEQARLAAAAAMVPMPMPTGGSRISNIFGTGGKNSVKVDTPDYKYGYQTDRK